MNIETLLEVRGLSVARTDQANRPLPGVPLMLDNIYLSVAKGEIVGIVGGSGAGKSTLGRALLGYARAGARITAGQVMFRGDDVLQLDQRQCTQVRGAQVAYIAQSATASFNPSLRIGTQIAEVIRLHRGLGRAAARQQMIELFTSLHLPEPEKFERRYPHQVSGGQLQRAMIAMALAGSPALIVFDEPTTALDPHTRAAVVALITSLVRQHRMAAVYISHDLEVVKHIADRVERLEHGVLLGRRQVQLWMERSPAVPLPRSNVQGGRHPSVHALQVDNLSAGFAERCVLNNVTFGLAKGRVLGVVGTSGSGKSTLARIICGLHPAYRGSVILNGIEQPRSIRARTVPQAQQVQMVYQSAETAINPAHTVQRVLERVVRACQGLSAAAAGREVRRLLGMVGLDDSFLGRTVHQMSGGQVQRIGIARALAAKPQLIIFDEVTSALDTDTAQEILKLLRSLQLQEGLTCLFISHDMGAVAALCDDVAVIADGEIVEIGPATTVLNAPAHARTRELFEGVAAVA